jgi:hypothetical protein
VYEGIDKCVVAPEAIEAIDRAESRFNRVKSLNSRHRPVWELIQEAKTVSKNPECNSKRAVLLADEAFELIVSGLDEALLGAVDTIEPAVKEGQVVSEKKKTKPKPVDNICQDLEDSGFGAHAGGGHPITAVTTLAVTTVTAITLCVPTTITNEIQGTRNAAYDRVQKYRFVKHNHNRLATDFSGGGGEYADTLVFLLGCPPESGAHYIDIVRQDFDQIFTSSDTDAEILLQSLETRITQHPELSSECSGAS